MIINLEENLIGFDRYNGGWVKSITGIDKDYNNGYSLKGEFVANRNAKNVNLEENTLYLDCSIGGSRKNPEKNYHLFKLEEDEIEIIQTIEDGQSDWAVQLWDTIETELNLKKTKAQTLAEKIGKLETEEFMEFMVELQKDTQWKMYEYMTLYEQGITDETINRIIFTTEELGELGKE